MKKLLLKIKENFFGVLPKWFITDLITLVFVVAVGITLSIIFVAPFTILVFGAV